MEPTQASPSIKQIADGEVVPQQKLHLVVGLPFCERPVTPEWAISLRNLVVPMNSVYGFAPTRGMPIDEARNALAQSALAYGAKYLLMLDDDTAAPQHAITNLMRILDGYPDVMVAGGIYFSREAKPQPIVFKEEGGGPTWDWTYGDVFECSSIGTGCMMIKTELFQHLEKPYFKTDTENVITDDIYFCRKVTAAGYKIAADGGVICMHWDVSTGKYYTMGKNDPPVVRYKQNQKAVAQGQIPNNSFGGFTLE